jgi:hypothetical protein
VQACPRTSPADHDATLVGTGPSWSSSLELSGYPGAALELPWSGYPGAVSLELSGYPVAVTLERLPCSGPRAVTL